MTQDLITTFGKSDGGTYDWKYKGLDPKLSAAEIKEACELLTNLDICTENGGKLFDSVVTAKVVIYKDTLIFDSEHETRGVNYYGEKVEKPVEEPTCEEVRCFEVAEKADVVKQRLPLSETPNRLMPTWSQLRERYVDRSQKAKAAKNTETAIKVAPDSLPTQNNKIQPAEIINAPTSAHDHFPQAAAQTTKKDVGLFHWIHKIRSRNKEDPANT